MDIFRSKLTIKVTKIRRITNTISFIYTRVSYYTTPYKTGFESIFISDFMTYVSTSSFLRLGEYEHFVKDVISNATYFYFEI